MREPLYIIQDRQRGILLERHRSLDIIQKSPYISYNIRTVIECITDIVRQSGGLIMSRERIVMIVSACRSFEVNLISNKGTGK